MSNQITKPCSQCPFVRGGIKLTRGRLYELASGAADDDRFMFHCHHTVDYETDDDGEGVITKDSQLCAGAMAFTLKTMGHPNQIMRIAERLGTLDLDAVEAQGRDTYDNIDEMVEEGDVCRPRPRTRKRPKQDDPCPYCGLTYSHTCTAQQRPSLETDKFYDF